MRKLSATAALAIAMLGVGFAVLIYVIHVNPVHPAPVVDPTLAATDESTDAVTATALPAPAPYSRIAFVSNRDGNPEIYTMESDGSDLMRLTTNHALDLYPQWSPDGTRIAWLSDQDGQRDLYVMHYDGGSVSRLTVTRESEYALRWSPDSRTIAVAGEGGRPGAANLVLIRATGGEPRLISDTLASDFEWSPDGTQLAFATTLGALKKVLIVENIETGQPVAEPVPQVAGQFAWSPTSSAIAYIINTSESEYQSLAIHLFDPISSEQRVFTTTETNTNYVRWSPHGSYLAYVQVDTPNEKLYVVDAAGNNPTFLATFYVPMSVDWSPDEAQLVYSTQAADGHYEIYTVQRNQPDSEPENIVEGMSPDWSPALPQITAHLPTLTPPPPTATPTPFPTMTPAPPGMTSRIVFYSTRDGNPEIYTMNPDGGDVIRLTDSEGGDIMPKWSPDGRRIAWMVWEDQEADLHVMNADGSNPIRLTNSPRYEYDFEWSPDSQWIAYTTVEENHGQHLYIVSTTGGDSIPVTTDYAGEFHWSPVSRSLAYNSFTVANNTYTSTSLQVYDLVTPSTQALLEGSEQPGAFAWSPDGSRLAVSFMKATPEDGAVLRLIDLATGEQTTLLDSDKGISDLHWSPDGAYLAYVSMGWMTSLRDIEIKVIPAQGGTPQHVTYFPYPSVQTVLPFTFDWSADSTQLVFSIEDTPWPNSYIIVVNRDGSALHAITDASSSNQMPDCSPYLPANTP